MIVKSDKSSFESYLEDAANIKGQCDQIYFPESSGDISDILHEASRSNKKITISAGRTGLNGGSVPNEGILISTEKLNQIISIDSFQNTVVVEPGVILCDLQKYVEGKDLFYPPDPTETNCCLGGTIANNASGARSFKYGSSRNFVKAIKIILSDGYEFEIERGKYFLDNLNANLVLPNGNNLEFKIPDYKMPDVKHSAGYFCKPNMDIIDLFIGSEGTLGVISQIKLKLISLPKNVLSMIIFFDHESDLFSFIQELRSKCSDDNEIIDLREIEFFDKNTLRILREDYSNIPHKSMGAVWIEQEFTDENEELIINEIDRIINDFNGDIDNIWFASSDQDRNKLKEFRHKIALKVNDIISSRKLIKVGTDTAVPDDKFAEFYNFTTSIIEKNNIEYVVYGHIGNSHLHFNMLPKTEDELVLCRRIYGLVCKKSIELGGTISAEHGIGKLKTNYLLDMFGEENIIKMAKLKMTLDPNMILNVGNIFDKKYLLLDKD